MSSELLLPRGAALSEDKSPGDLALDWFTREMRLPPSIPSEESRVLPGVTSFDLFTAALLLVFSAAMLPMYFFKIRRTATLFSRLGPVSRSPPPGDSPMRVRTVTID